MGNTPVALSVYIAEDKYPLCSHNVSVTQVKIELVRIFIQNTFLLVTTALGCGCVIWINLKTFSDPVLDTT